jgi:hypothetical protein
MTTKILCAKNLKRYLKKRDKPWGIDSLIYERLPVLAVRNYLNDYEDENEWPLCWQGRRGIEIGLAVSLETLKAWQAFRPRSIDEMRRPLGKIVPRAVRRVQARLVKHGVYRARDLAGKNKKIVADVVAVMARAVAQVSEVKSGKRKATPMLGSKVLHFFFPEFFPVWDTAWIKKELKKWNTDDNGMPPSLQRALSKGPKDRVALEYARYVCLMLQDIKSLQRGSYDRLKATCVRNVQSRNNHKLLRQVLDDNVYDLSPMLFELCVIGAQPRKNAA